MDPFGGPLLAGSMPAHKVFDPNTGSRSGPEPVQKWSKSGHFGQFRGPDLGPNSALQKWYFGPPKRGPIHTESPSNGVPDLANLSPKPDLRSEPEWVQKWSKSGQFGPLLGSNMDPFGDRLLAGSMPAHKVFDPNTGSRSEPEPVPTGSYGFEVLVGGYS